MVLSFGYDLFGGNQEPSSDNGHMVSEGTYTEGEGNASSSAAANGEGNISSSTVVTGDGSTTVNGDVYNGEAAATQSYGPEEFEDYNKALAYSASLIERGKEETVGFLLDFMQIEDLDKQTRTAVKYNYGTCCLRMAGRLPEAVPYLSDAASVSCNPYAYYNLGCAYLYSQEYEKAEKALETALELSDKPGWNAPAEDKEHFRAALTEAEEALAAAGGTEYHYDFRTKSDIYYVCWNILMGSLRIVPPHSCTPFP